VLDEDHVVAVHQRPAAVRALLVRGGEVVLDGLDLPGRCDLVDPAVGVEEPLAGREMDGPVPLDLRESLVTLQLEGDLTRPGLGGGADSLADLGERDPREPTPALAADRELGREPRLRGEASLDRLGDEGSYRIQPGHPTRGVEDGSLERCAREAATHDRRRRPMGPFEDDVAIAAAASLVWHEDEDRGAAGQFRESVSSASDGAAQYGVVPGEPECTVEALLLGRLAAHQTDLAPQTLLPEP
jgi:hypothetical protein